MGEKESSEEDFKNLIAQSSTFSSNALDNPETPENEAPTPSSRRKALDIRA